MVHRGTYPSRYMVSTLVVTPMMRPHPWASMWGTAARAMWNGPLELTATILLHMSGAMSQKARRGRGAPGAGRVHYPSVVYQNIEAAEPVYCPADRFLRTIGV